MTEVDTCKSFIKLDADGNTETIGSTEKAKKVSNVVSGSRTAVMDQGRGIIYLSHIPFGFFEKEMYKFFSQFGSVTNLRLGRSKKTGGSRGYAFIEFRYADVAKIVAETMNNYLMFEKLLKCKVVPTEQVKASMFKGKVDPRSPSGIQARILAKKADQLEEVRKARNSTLKRASFTRQESYDKVVGTPDRGPDAQDAPGPKECGDLRLETEHIYQEDFKDSL